MKCFALLAGLALLGAGCGQPPGNEISGGVSIVGKLKFIPIAFKYNMVSHQVEVSFEKELDFALGSIAIEAAAATNAPTPAKPSEPIKQADELIVKIGEKTETYALKPDSVYGIRVPNDVNCEITIFVDRGKIYVNIPNPTWLPHADEADLDAERARQEAATAKAQTLEKDLDNTRQQLEQEKMANTPYAEPYEPPTDTPSQPEDPPAKPADEDPGYQPESLPELPGDTSRSPGGIPLPRGRS